MRCARDVLSLFGEYHARWVVDNVEIGCERQREVKEGGGSRDEEGTGCPRDVGKWVGGQVQLSASRSDKK